jgi:hypothetical protein
MFNIFFGAKDENPLLFIDKQGKPGEKTGMKNFIITNDTCEFII